MFNEKACASAPWPALASDVGIYSPISDTSNLWL